MLGPRLGAGGGDDHLFREETDFAGTRAGDRAPRGGVVDEEEVLFAAVPGDRHGEERAEIHALVQPGGEAVAAASDVFERGRDAVVHPELVTAGEALVAPSLPG